jgi:ABC-type multidrug transport system permease subunit
MVHVDTTDYQLYHFPSVPGLHDKDLSWCKSISAIGKQGGMFSDMIKLIIAGLIYAIPLLILEIVLFASPGLVKTSSVNPGTITGLIIAVLIGSIIIVIVAILIWLITTTAGVRFARTDNFFETFNFREIFAHIGRIGWMDYIIALLMMLIVFGIITLVCLVIPYIGAILFLIVLPFMGLFSARYITLLYESANPE